MLIFHWPISINKKGYFPYLSVPIAENHNGKNVVCGITTNHFGDCSYANFPLQDERLRDYFNKETSYRMIPQHNTEISIPGTHFKNTGECRKCDILIMSQNTTQSLLLCPTADCPIVCLAGFREQHHTISAMIHSGYYGTNHNIVISCLKYILKYYKIDYFYAFLWAGTCQQCELSGVQKNMNLAETIIFQLSSFSEKSKTKVKKLTIIDYCPSCHYEDDKFYSRRRGDQETNFVFMG